MWWLFISFLIVVLDQATKLWALHFLKNDIIVLLPVLQLNLAFNSGAAFSFLSHAGGWQNLFFIVFAVIIIAAFIIVLWRSKQKSSCLAMSFIIGGALGNLIDRLHYAYVIDFIDAHVGGHHWPIFNIADACITIGVCIMLFDCIRGKK
jgi:signal peptidase II